MNPYKEASLSGIGFCWCCTKKELLECFEVTLYSKWKLQVMKIKLDGILSGMV